MRSLSGRLDHGFDGEMRILLSLSSTWVMGSNMIYKYNLLKEIDAGVISSPSACSCTTSASQKARIAAFLWFF